MRRLLPLLALAMVGCATPYGKSAPGWVVRKMSYEGRLWLLDAEEELAVAQLKLEEAEAEHERARKARASAERKLARHFRDQAAVTDALLDGTERREAGKVVARVADVLVVGEPGELRTQPIVSRREPVDLLEEP